ncbi:MAG: ATP-grasp domain-containing protein [Myxococcales bacterium]|nr:ATP-grasp domain-containing protein [Myxococcales bacterium]
MHVVFAAPFFMETTLRFVRAVAELPGVRTTLVTQEPKEKIPPDLREKLAGYCGLDRALDADAIEQGVRMLSHRHGRPHRLIGALEHIQVQLAQVRAALDIDGMRPEAAKNFRDKVRMKDVLRAAGLPCARHRQLDSEQDAWPFVQAVGYPIVVKPLAGAGSAVTFRCDTDEELRHALACVRPSLHTPAAAEEFIVGEEHSFEVASVDGRPVWHSLTKYAPPPLDVIRNPWIQWTVLLPRDISGPEWNDVRTAGVAALKALGMGTGISHMEWFRRKDGSLAISEIAARPPGAQIMTMNSFAHDTDMYRAWARLVVRDEVEVGPRGWAVGTAYFRGQGQGARVKRIHGLDRAQKDIGHLVVEARLPQIGQPAATSYEGEGYAMVRHRETAVVENAVRHLIETVRLELG